MSIDPPENERIYYRHKSTGDKAYLVMRDGQQHIKYDRPYDPTTMKFMETDWVLDQHPEPFSLGQAIMVAFETDRSLCRMLGIHAESKKQWQSMTEQERVRFMSLGPNDPKHPIRDEIYKAVRKLLEPYTRPT